MFETQPKSILPDSASRLGTMPLSFDLGVDNLPRGQYDSARFALFLDPCSVQKAAYWRSPIMLVQ